MKIKQSIKTGVSFGLISGVITTLGLLIGLETATNSKIAIVSGIITIAIADAFSDALGIHMSQESNKKNTNIQVLKASTSAFFTKLIVASTFLIPVLLLSMQAAIIVSIIYGLTLITIFSYMIAKIRNTSPLKGITIHLVVAIIVIILTYSIGKIIATYI
jgi:VIT1/CCC1 family predicted Fe2+/Mn2+ transporter